MKVLILGMGHIGKALAVELRAQGHSVVGTTTTAGKVAELAAVADEVAVLRGSESEKVVAAAKGCDVVIVTVAPDVRQTRTVEERHTHYRDVLVSTCASAARACDRSIFASSFSVYGDGGSEPGPVTENTPTGNHEEPSSRYYQLAEAEILATGHGCVLRYPDMYGAPGDMSYPQRVGMCHEYFGGKAIFSADAPLYCIHFEDVMKSIMHALNENLKGVFNVCDEDRLPHTNREVFDAICDAEGMERLEFLGHIKAPTRKISARKIYDTGYRVGHGDPNASFFGSGN